MSITPMETVSQDAAASGLVTVPAAGCRPARTAGTASRNSRRSTRKPIHPEEFQWFGRSLTPVPVFGANEESVRSAHAGRKKQ